MTFELLPTLSAMYALYQKPRSVRRFQHDYLQLLQGNTKGDLVMPIGNWNPMAKEHLLEKISAMQALDAEGYLAHILQGLNSTLAREYGHRVIRVSICIADDLLGGWTNRYTTDYDNRFKINALLQRNFCTPIFWSSEDYDLEKIRLRTLAACYRSVYWLNKPKPQTLHEHLQQEMFVAQKTGLLLNKNQSPELQKLYTSFRDSDNYTLIFNYLYGDKASNSLSMPIWGVEHGWLDKPVWPE